MPPVVTRTCRNLRLALLPALLAASPGCVERMLQVESEPTGALVYLNGEETGRTPMRKEFVWYGTYDVQVRKEGYQAVSTPTKVWAPWWQIPPIDLFAEIFPLPLVDNHVVRYRLEPLGAQQTDPQPVLDRAVQLRDRLHTSEYTRQPKPPHTQPTTKPAP